MCSFFNQKRYLFEKVTLCGNDGVITSDCAVPYLDASYYAIILNGLLFLEIDLW